jgi:hypothetical protein
MTFFLGEKKIVQRLRLCIALNFIYFIYVYYVFTCKNYFKILPQFEFKYGTEELSCTCLATVVFQASNRE